MDDQRLCHQIDLPLWRPDPLIDPTRTRRDDVWRLSLVESAPITNDFGLYLQLQYDRVHSTLINFSYNNFTVLFGPQFHF
jgi:hypothetical protein